MQRIERISNSSRTTCLGRERVIGEARGHNDQTTSMTKQKHFLTLLFLLGAWSGASIAHAASADAVVAWGADEYGQTTVPVTAQGGVTAIAAGSGTPWP